MDHLPRPANATLGSLQIPYLSTFPYDGGPFSSFPARHGWELLSRESAHTFMHNRLPATPEATSAFLQTWLYFGLLSETLGRFWRPEKQSLFVEEGKDGRRWLRTECLEAMVAEWAGCVSEVSAGMSWKTKLRMWWKKAARISSTWVRARLGLKTTEYREEVGDMYNKFQENLKLAQKVILFAQRSGSENLGVDQALALMALGAFLTSAWWCIYRHFHKGKLPEQLVSIEVAKFITEPFLRRHMREQKWCRSDISRIMGKGSSTMMWYYVNMQPPKPETDHFQCLEDECSENECLVRHCSENHCAANQISPSVPYKLAHTEKDCKCHLIRAELGDLRKILVDNDIPVLNFEKDEEVEKSTVSVHRSSEADFVAISHIWAEGLGDPHDNALHYCEVKRLFELIGLLPTRPRQPRSRRHLQIARPQSRSLWIDTMCVPAKDSELKKLAMGKMRDTYSFAAEVLVLDAYVQRFERKRATPLEAFTRVVNSSWMQRLWTLQEGRLAQKIYFQFSDGPVELRDIFNSIPLREFPIRADLAANQEITMSYRASKFHTYEEQKKILRPLYEGIFATREAVMFRGLSVESDEAICLSTLMNLDVDDIIRTDEDKRMEKLWTMIPKVPLSLVFSRAPKKLPTPGFHWAPSSFRGPVANHKHDWWAGPDHLWSKMEAEQTQYGLLVQLPGLFLQPINAKEGWSKAIDMGPNHVFQLSDGRWFGLGVEGPWNQLTKETQPEKCTERMALILEDSSLTERVHDAFEECTVIANDIPSKTFLRGLIANVKLAEGDKIHVAGLRHAEILEVPPEFSTIFTAAVTAARELWGRLTSETADPEVVNECIAVAKGALLDPKVLDACRNQRRVAGADESDEEVMYMIGGMIRNVYVGGYNSAEVAPEGCKWYVD